MKKSFVLRFPRRARVGRYGMLCCPECFKNDWVREFIKQESRVIATCEFCEAQNVPVLEVSLLTEPFQKMTSMYSPVSDDNTMSHVDYFDAGETLDFFVQDDWDVYSDRLDRLKQTAHLLKEILNACFTETEWSNGTSGDTARFDPNELYTSRREPADFTWSDEWDEHLHKAMKSARGLGLPFGIPRKYLEKAVSTLPTNSVVYRARNGFTEVTSPTFSSHREPYRGDDIGAPPSNLAFAGRANREGQVVFYCADEERTAVAEVRPARGFLVSVGEFHTTRDLKLLDLVKSRPPINPFTDAELSDTVELHALFKAFANNLKTPLRHGDDTAIYLPCQNLTDTVREAGFDGIRYPSAMSPGGSNIVFFNPKEIDFTDSKLVEVVVVEVEFRVHPTLR